MESIHPAIVHFPIALLITALAMDGLAVLLKRPTLHRVALWNLGLGTLGAAAAVASGLRAEEVAKHSFEIHQFMELHKRLGITTLILGLGLTAWRLRTRDHLSPRAWIAVLAAMVLMVSVVGFGAFLGGRLVYEFGVGHTHE